MQIEQAYGFSPAWVRSCWGTSPSLLKRLRKSTPRDQCRCIPQCHLGVRLVLPPLPLSGNCMTWELPCSACSVTITTTTTTTLQSVLDFWGLCGRSGWVSCCRACVFLALTPLARSDFLWQGAGCPTTWVGVCGGAGFSPEALVLSGVGSREWWQAQSCRTCNGGMRQHAGSNGE